MRGTERTKEADMSTTLKTILAFGLLAITTACAQQEEVVVVEPVVEEAPMSKY